MNDQWNQARLERHKAEHNVEEARVTLAAAEALLRQARRNVQDLESCAYGNREALEPWPLPTYPLGRKAP